MCVPIRLRMSLILTNYRALCALNLIKILVSYSPVGDPFHVRFSNTDMKQVRLYPSWLLYFSLWERTDCLPACKSDASNCTISPMT